MDALGGTFFPCTRSLDFTGPGVFCNTDRPAEAKLQFSNSLSNGCLTLVKKYRDAAAGIQPALPVATIVMSVPVPGQAGALAAGQPMQLVIA